MPDFKKLLAKSVDTIVRPPQSPAGTYNATITGHKYQESPWVDKVTGEKEAQVNFLMRITSYGPDVDENKANVAKTIGKVVNRAFSIDDGKEWPLRMFLESLGIPVAGKTLDVVIPETTGASVMLEMGQRTNPNDPSQQFLDVKKVRAAS